MFHNFPRQGKIISVILIIVIGYFIYIEWSRSPYNRTNDLKPGSKEYEFYHGDKWNDTISQRTVDHDTIPEIKMHYWYKDSNEVWHEDNENGRTDSSDYLRTHKK